ncbi:MAG: glutamylcysteine synthetase [Clostridium sp.]|nr:glutamylcysteine synthetase [Clostridium sp.]
MIEKEWIRQKLYQKYIEPTKKKRQEYIGIEVEMPVVNLDKQAVDFQYIHRLTECFMEHFQFEAESYDDDGHINAVKHPENGDILSYDCAYHNLELSLGREKTLQGLYQRFAKYYTFIQKELKKCHYTLTGMGVNPYRNYNQNIPIPNGRYRMLYHHLNSYSQYRGQALYFHEYPDYGMFSSASQVQLDVNYEELPMMIRAFSRVEPLKALLFNNSILIGEHEELACCRDMFWENSTHGINPHNIGMYDCEIESVEDLLAYLESVSMYCVEREGKYINFPPISVMEYFEQDTITGEYYDNGIYRGISFAPEIEDLEYLRTFKFEDLTFRGTIEFRSVCCQPIADVMTVSAFHLGLKKQLDRLDALLREDHVLYHHGFSATELRRLFVKQELPAFVEEEQLYELAGQVVDLAKRGLEERGYGEEVYLMPLYQRIRQRVNPAQRMLRQIKGQKRIEDMILEYSCFN